MSSSNAPRALLLGLSCAPTPGGSSLPFPVLPAGHCMAPMVMPMKSSTLAVGGLSGLPSRGLAPSCRLVPAALGSRRPCC